MLRLRPVVMLIFPDVHRAFRRGVRVSPAQYHRRFRVVSGRATAS